jgi:CubicO group peptidase (beta-lactamase class C family)
MPAHADALVAALRSELGPRLGHRSPAQAWGVFSSGRLVHVHAGGDEVRLPAQTAFRIASCTKSFTAASALLLEADGLLDLGEPLADALDVPLRLIGDVGGPPPTIRDALSMRAGFPTDDPWADRQESLDDDTFGRMLGDGVRTMWPAGIRYEYSNLGYAIVGRIIGLRARMPYRRVVETRLLEPLGLAGTGFASSVPAMGGVIPGYRRAPDGWERLPFSGPGAFSPIGGLFSTVDDLARWGGVLAQSGDLAGLLPRALTERMQQPEQAVSGDPAGAGPWLAYGLGLVLREDASGRRFVAHSGGYPGFSSFMTWESGSGVGAVAFENATYAGVTIAVRAAMDAAFDSAPVAEADAEPAVPWPETVQAAEWLRAELAGGAIDDDDRFEECVGLDRPFDWRRAELSEAIASIGGVVEIGPLTHRTPAHAGWTLSGPDGAIRCSILMSPLAATRVQRLDVTLEPLPA